MLNEKNLIHMNNKITLIYDEINSNENKYTEKKLSKKDNRTLFVSFSFFTALLGAIAIHLLFSINDQPVSKESLFSASMLFSAMFPYFLYNSFDSKQLFNDFFNHSKLIFVLSSLFIILLSYLFGFMLSLPFSLFYLVFSSLELSNYADLVMKIICSCLMVFLSFNSYKRFLKGDIDEKQIKEEIVENEKVKITINELKNEINNINTKILSLISNVDDFSFFKHICAEHNLRHLKDINSDIESKIIKNSGFDNFDEYNKHLLSQRIEKNKNSIMHE